MCDLEAAASAGGLGMPAGNDEPSAPLEEHTLRWSERGLHHGAVFEECGRRA